MRILHTSDWHLGQHFYAKSRKHEHQAFLNWLLQQVETLQVDAVIVAGDIFDTGTPPSYAREMYNRFVVDIHRLNSTLVVLGGNHDSVSVLNESRQLVSCLSTYVVASAANEIEEQLLELKGRSGETEALLCAVPFLRARDLVESRAGETGVEKRRALAEAIQTHYQQLFTLAQQRSKALQRQLPIIATGHLAALGVSQSESVREIYIGSMEGFDASGFPPADYIALGHIHRPQLVAGKSHIRYSGSPLALSFDELKSEKQVLLVDFAQPEATRVTPIAVPCFQPMQALKGDLATIKSQLAALDLAEEQTLWLSIEVLEDDLLVDLRQQIQQLTDDINVEVLQLKRGRDRSGVSIEQQQALETLSELSPSEVFGRRLALESMETEEQIQRAERLKQQFSTLLVALSTEAEA